MEWFWFWLVFVILLVALPLAYGWRYRGWGPPSAPYRRRAAAAEDAEEEATWGVLAVLVWVTLTVAVAWLLVAFFV